MIKYLNFFLCVWLLATPLALGAEISVGDDTITTAPPNSQHPPPAMELVSVDGDQRTPHSERVVGMTREAGTLITARVRNFEKGADILIFEAFDEANKPSATFNGGNPLAIVLDLERLETNLVNAAISPNHKSETLIPVKKRGVLYIAQVHSERERVIEEDLDEISYDHLFLIIGIKPTGELLDFFHSGDEALPYTFVEPLSPENDWTFEGAAAVDDAGQILIAVTRDRPGSGINPQPQEVIVMRIGPDGLLDPHFGLGGTTRIPFPISMGGYGFRSAETQTLQILKNGAIVITGSWTQAQVGGSGYFRVLLDPEGLPIKSGPQTSYGPFVYRNEQGVYTSLPEMMMEGLAPGMFISKFPSLGAESSVGNWDLHGRWGQRGDPVASDSGAQVSVLLPSWIERPKSVANDDIVVSEAGFTVATRPFDFDTPFLGQLNLGYAHAESLSPHLATQNPLSVDQAMNEHPYQLRMRPTGAGGSSILWGTRMGLGVKEHAFYHLSSRGTIDQSSALQFGSSQKVEFHQPDCVHLLANIDPP